MVVLVNWPLKGKYNLTKHEEVQDVFYIKNGRNEKWSLQ